jgi:hypothetical protein
MPDTALRTLLAGSIDYAGLFPPAGLDVAASVRQYADYRSHPDAWALGRFVVPAARLAELEQEAALFAPASQSPSPAGSNAEPWRLSALLGTDALRELEALGEFNCRHAAAGAPALSADVVEVRADSVEAVDDLLAAVPRWAQAYVEIPLDRNPVPLVAAIARRGGRAKARMGGITPDAFPSAEAVSRFLRACTDAGVPFKVTAGLHHPLRAEYRLTYAPDSPHGTMFGFLNVFLAAAWLHHGMGNADVVRLLEERSSEAIRFDGDAVDWRGHRLDLGAIGAARATGIVAFGSCSFTEPVGELRAFLTPQRRTVS